MKKSLLEIENELKIIGEPRSKAPLVVKTSVGGGIALIGLYPLFSGIVFFANNWILGLILIIIGSVLILGGGTLSIISAFVLRNVTNENKEIERLQKERETLLEEQKQSIQEKERKEQEESNEDTLLGLLSEGRITVEEYKKLSKKK